MSECLVVSYTKMSRKKVRPILSYLSFEDSIQIIDFLCIPPMLPTQSDDNLVTLVEKNNG